eukprot:251434_1
MPEITVELIRRKAEHNEGMIHSLEELSLHQEELESINRVLGVNCRKLKVLYLQNNIIKKIENLHHMKDLQYLNLALNNIDCIQGLHACEFLTKLDLTLNFIDFDRLEESVQHLRGLPNLKELYMTGNPCQSEWTGFSDYIAFLLPQLECLDGKGITHSMRIQAGQRISALRVVLQTCVEDAVHRKMKNLDVAEPKDNELTQHTPSTRARIYRQLAEEKKESEDRRRNMLPKERDIESEQKEAVVKAREREKEGNIMQCNQGKWDFDFDEEALPGTISLRVSLPRFLDSSLIDLDVHPSYVSIVVKGKVLRLCLPVEVKAECSKAQRSKITGDLVISMPKVNAMETIGLSKRQPLKSDQKQQTSVCPTPTKQMTLGELLMQEAELGNDDKSKVAGSICNDLPPA